MLSDRAKVQIEYMKQFRRRRTDHLHAVQTVTDLILKGEIQLIDDVRDLCKEFGWYPKPTDELCAMVDDVGFTLLALGKIERW